MADYVLSDLPERYQNKIVIGNDGDCWRWIGTMSDKGYGVATLNKKQYRAHRLMYELATGTKINNGYLACHACDNRWCVSPNHIFPGTYQDNMNDAKGKKRTNAGEAHPRHKLTSDQIVRIREMARSGARIGASLAKEFGVNPTTVQRALKGKTWQRAEHDFTLSGETYLIKITGMGKEVEVPTSKQTSDKIMELLLEQTQKPTKGD